MDEETSFILYLTGAIVIMLIVMAMTGA